MRAVAAVPLERLLQGIPSQIRGNPNTPITSIATDSRRVQPGAAFFCLRGQHVDGHDFARAAVAAGATAVIGRRNLDVPRSAAVAIVMDPLAALSPASAAFFQYPSRQLTCVGVTGTNGKTTTTFLAESIVRAAGLRFGLSGTLGEWLGGVLQQESVNTTPFANELQRWLANCRDAGAQGAIMEVSSHSLDQHRVDDVEFDVAVLTNLTQDHLDFHGTFEAYRDAKRKLFIDERKRRTKAPLTAVLNVDDAEGATLAKIIPKRLTFGINNPDATFNATDVRLGPDGSTFAVRSLRPAPFALRLPGPFNVSNALAALGIACALDVDVEAMADGLENVREVPGRMVALPAGEATVYIDYAHTPDGLEKVLRAARAATQNRLLCVFGCGGDRDRSKRPLMGRIAQEIADHVIITTDNPRHEDPDAIIAEIVAGMRRGGAEHEVIRDRSRAIERAIRLAQPGDVVLIAGKGHEAYQIVGDERIPYSDVDVAHAAIREAPRCR